MKKNKATAAGGCLSVRLATLILCVLMAGALLVPLTGNVFGVQAEQTEEELQAAYRKKLQAAQEQKADFEKKKQEQEALIAEFTEEKENIEAYITELDLQMNDISLKIFDLKNEISDTEAELEVTRKNLDEAQERERQQYENMKRRIAYMYENGEVSYLDVLLSSADIADFLNRLEYVQEIVEYDNRLLERYKAAKEDVMAHQALVEASLEELKAMKKNAELEQETMEVLIALKGAEIDKLTEQLGLADEYLFNYMQEISNQEMEIEEIIEAEEKRVEEVERRRKEEEERLRKEAEERARKEAEEKARLEAEERERLEAEQAKREEQNAAVKTPASTKGYDADAINHVVLSDETDPDRMAWPLPGDYRTYSRFGPRVAPTAGASTYHKGWDIGGEFGAPMVSVLAGTVIAVDYNSSAGNYVKVEHECGIISVYCHCSRTLVEVGQYVQQNEKVALVGSTGVSTGAHLHFALQTNGTYIDPAPYISKYVD